MAISSRKYVDIQSGVGGGSAVRRRQLIARLMTTNPRLPTGTFVEITGGADEVGAYFGFDSEEYKRAAFYFAFISKATTRAQSISFARWAEVDTAPLILGASAAYSLPAFTAINSGSFELTIGGLVEEISGLDFTGAISLAAVAGIVQTAVRASQHQRLADAATKGNPAAQFEMGVRLAEGRGVSVDNPAALQWFEN